MKHYGLHAVSMLTNLDVCWIYATKREAQQHQKRLSAKFPQQTYRIKQVTVR